MNTMLTIRIQTDLEEIKIDREYTDVFPKGILSAGREILSNPDMTAMARRAIFQLGRYQNRMDFMLNDLYTELIMLDMRYRISSGDTSDIEENLGEDDLHQLQNVLNDLKEDSYDYSLRRDEYILGALRLVYETAKKGINKIMHADSMYAICRLALKSGYRIIIEDADVNSFGSGVFKDLFEPESPEDIKSVAIVSHGLSFKVTFNDAQTNLSQSDPISNRIKKTFPEAETVSIKVQRRVSINE